MGKRKRKTPKNDDDTSSNGVARGSSSSSLTASHSHSSMSAAIDTVYEANSAAKNPQPSKNGDHMATRNRSPPTVENPLRDAQLRFLSSVPTKIRDHFFSESLVAPDERARAWSDQADLGEELVDAYAWATPDERALRILRHFAPIVEVGCGSNAYWSRMMHRAGIDVVAYDIRPNSGGKIKCGDGVGSKSKKGSRKNNGNEKKDANASGDGDGFRVRQGGPAILSTDPKIRNSGRALFLCYPDEDDDEVALSKGKPPMSLGASCLNNFTGEAIVLVGELYGDTLSLDQAPWGRSSSSEFQQHLAATYHCVLKASLTSWLHVRDTISIWKRSETCTIVFQGDDEDDSDEEVAYRHIPKGERLPVDAAAPSVAHLLRFNTENHRKIDSNPSGIEAVEGKRKTKKNLKK